MSEQAQNNTGTQDNSGDSQTDASQASATDQQAQSGASQSADQSGNSDDKVVLSKEAHAELVAQRDRNFNDKQSLEERMEALENSQARDQFLDSWLKENSEKYPNVQREDLDLAQSPDDVEEIAQFAERKFEDAKQKALQDIQKVDAPAKLTQEEFAKKEKELKKQAEEGEGDPFDAWLDAQGQLQT